MRSIAHFCDVSPRGEIAHVQFKAGERDLWLAEMRVNEPPPVRETPACAEQTDLFSGDPQLFRTLRQGRLLI
jgi:hypothetical protein